MDLLQAVPMEMLGVKSSTNHSHRSVQKLQAMINRLFPSKKNQSSENSEQLPIIDREVKLSNRTNTHVVNASILLDQRDNNRFENSSLRKGYQWLFNEDMIEDPIDTIKEVFPWELKDSIFDDDLYALNRKKFFPNIFKNFTGENLNDAIHLHNSTIYQKDLLLDLSQALKTLQSIVDDDDEDDDDLSWKFLPFLESHPKHH